MKKLVAILLSLFAGASLAFAVNQSVWLSSNTATADTTKNLCPGISYTVASSSYTSQSYTSGNHAIFHGACINTGSAGTLTIYNSSATATSPIAAINTTTAQPCSLYD